MKKIYSILTIIVLLTTFKGISQQSYFKAPAGSATTTARVPNGSSGHAYFRGCFVIPASELCGISTVTALNTFGFCLVNGCSTTPVTGTIQIYLQNTNDISYQKGNTWATAIAPMTSVYNGNMTLPLTAGASTINLTLSSPFTYTGGGLYVAYDWVCNGPYETSATVANSQAATNIPIGGASQASNVAPPSAIGNTNTRPNFNFGYINTFTNEIALLEPVSHAKIPMIPYAPYSFSVIAKNQSSVAVTNPTFDLVMTGANAYNTSTTVPSIPANGTMMIGFSGFTPTAQGISNVTMSCLPDDNNCNNMVTTTQSVTCEVLGLASPSSAVNNYSVGVGFPTGGGSIVMRIRPAVNSTLNAVECGIGNDPSNVGKPVFVLLLNSGGGLIAMSNTITLTAAHLNKFISFYFATPQPLLANTVYHTGMSQPLGGYFPFACLPKPTLPPNFYFQSGVTGGFLFTFTQNFGMFGFEPVFKNGIDLTVNSATICSGQSATLTANSSVGNYSWTPTASTASQIVVTPSVTTLYEVYTASPTTCWAKKGAIVTVNITPTITCLDGGICPTPGSYTFNPQGAATYTWAPAGPIDNPTVTTQYTVVGSSTAGCISNVLTPSIIVTNSVVINTVASPSYICIGKNSTITASGASTYTWTTLPPSTLNPIVVSPAVPNTYAVTGVVGTCSATTNVFLNVFPNPTVTINASNFVYCQGNPPTVLTATGAGTYSWSTGATTQTAAVTPTSVLTYSVLGTDVNGCTDIEFHTIGPASSPTITASSSDPTLCINNTATITATGLGLVSYSWSPNTATTSAIMVSPTVNTTYTVTGYNATNCFGTYTLTQFVDPCAGIKEINANSVKAVIYPNPNNGIFNIMVSTISENMSIELYNILGEFVSSQAIKDTLTPIDMGQMANGVYLVKIKEGSKVLETTRVVKQ